MLFNKNEVISSVLPLLKDPNKNIRTTAVNTLTVLQAKEATPKIRSLLQDKEVTVRLAVIAALAKLQVKEAIPNLVFFIKNGDPKIRIGTMNALLDLQGTEAIHTIVPLLDDKVIDVRAATEERLAQIQNPLVTTLINKTFILMMVVCPLLAFLPLFFSGKKFYVSIGMLIAAVFCFRYLASITPYYPQFKEGSSWGGIYQWGILVAFGITIFLKVIWYVITIVFKRSPSVERVDKNARYS